MARRPSRLRDWLFGSTAKRLLLRALLAEPDRQWTQQALADKIGVHRKGGVTGHVRALEQIGLLTKEEMRWQLVPGSPLLQPLEQLLDAVELVPDKPLSDE